MKKNIENNPKMDEIAQIENKYGLFLFRMSLTHLIDVGVRNFTEENVAESIGQIEKQCREDRKNGISQIMTPECQCEIVRCADELSRKGIWNLIVYIKKYIAVE